MVPGFFRCRFFMCFRSEDLVTNLEADAKDVERAAWPGNTEWTPWEQGSHSIVSTPQLPAFEQHLFYTCFPLCVGISSLTLRDLLFDLLG